MTQEDWTVAGLVAFTGPGHTVLVIDEGNGARQILRLNPGAIRSVMVGLVDQVALSG
jgi:microcompartment protein CcmK/EutM